MVNGFGRVLCQECCGPMVSGASNAKTANGARVLFFKCVRDGCGHVTMFTMSESSDTGRRSVSRSSPEAARV